MPQTRQSSWIKWLLILLVLGGAIVGGFAYLKRSKDTPVDFKTAAISRGDLTQAVTANGQLSPVINVQVGSQISGIINEIKVDFNSKVKQGDVIAQIDPATYESSVTQAEADLLSAKAALELAQINNRRALELRKVISSPRPKRTKPSTTSTRPKPPSRCAKPRCKRPKWIWPAPPFTRRSTAW